MLLPLFLVPAAGLLRLAQAALYDDQVPFPIYSNTTPPILAVPSEAWTTLNASVGGRLFPGVPFAKPCFAKYEGSMSDVETEECEQVKRTYSNESVRTGTQVAQINTQWETCQARAQSCLLDSVDPFNPDAAKLPNECHQGSVSNYFIDVRTPSDIQAALAFARTTNVPIVIKNTGHDYKGRSSAPYSLALWMHNLQDFTYHPAFTPTCPEYEGELAPEQAVTMGAGVQWFEAYAFAEENGITLVGGADRTVGAVGGWLQGGGHGALSNTLGMGADRVREFSVVTPDGKLRIANRCQNQDLFFALRGGGGGTFGVVLSATTRADPKVTMQAVLVEFPEGMIVKGFHGIDSDLQGDDKTAVTGDDDEDPLAITRSLWSLLVKNGVKWAQEGWGAYANGNSALYLNPVLNKDEAAASIEELVEWGNKLKAAASEGTSTGKSNVVVIQDESNSWGECYNKFADGNAAHLGEPLALASRLIPASSFATAESRAELVDALIAVEREAPGVRFLKTTPFNYPKATSSPSKSSESSDHPSLPYSTPAINPAWRTSIFHVTTIVPWNWNATPAEIDEKYMTATRAVEHLRRITGKNGGAGQIDLGAAYVNEADVYEADHESVFWGENYSRLLEIKNKYDPDRILDCWHCVGWNRDSPRFSCYL